MNAELKTTLAKVIGEKTGKAFRASSCRPQGGGCINEAWLMNDGPSSYFVKCNTIAGLAMFEAEAAALKELADTNTIKVPHPISHSTAAGQSYLILEALPFGSAKPGSWEAMGQQLAQLHRATTERFGWHRDNVIGSTPQHNNWTDDWPVFFREQRLSPQFELAQRNGFIFAHADELLEQVADILAGHTPAPSLLHGDLWSGNASFLDDGTPVIFDPATYYGDRETDLAFSEFFGGFPASFYNAYVKEWPFPPGYEQRKILYNLYHVLNHANLFGGSYASQAQSMVNRLLK